MSLKDSKQQIQIDQQQTNHSQIASLEREQAELKEQIRQLQEREQANAELLATVSHEIRTPIGAIMTMVELLQTTNLSSNQNHYAQTLQLAAKNLSTLTTDILNFARLEAGHVELEDETFNLANLLETITSSIRPRAKDKGLVFSCNLSPNCPEFIKSDQVRLNQIINNLANNALKFTEKGSLTLNVTSSLMEETEEGKCHLIRVELRDTGIGMDKVEQEKIFTPFCQANSSIQTKFGGSGLGLYISRTLAEHMGGELQYKSLKDIGSTFWFTFKCVEASNAEESSKDCSDGKTEQAMNAHALIVEDNALNQMLIKTYLEQFGITYDCAENGQEAIDMVQRANKPAYDIILMDIMMPVMDGITATKELHRIWKNETPIPILALTANAMEDQVTKYFEAGVDGYVSKPIRGIDLFNSIEGILDKSKQDIVKTA